MSARSFFPILGMISIGIAVVVFVAIRADRKSEPGQIAQQNQPEKMSEHLLPPEQPGFVKTVQLADEQHAVPEMAQLEEAIDSFDLEKALQQARTLLNTKNVAVRREVVSALDWIGVPALFDLAALMTDSDTQVAGAAEKAFWNNLEDLEDPKVKVQLLSIPFESKDASTRAEAADQLGFVSPHHSFPALLNGLNDASPQVRETVRDNLWFLSGGENFQTYDQWAAWYSAHKHEFIAEESQTSSASL